MAVVHVPVMRHDISWDIPNKENLFQGALVQVKDCALWTAMVKRYDILPGFLEFMYHCEGGALALTTFAATDASAPGRSGSIATSSASGPPNAYHLAYDPGGSLSDGECLIYARLDLITRQSLVLLFGIAREDPPDALTTSESRLRRIHRLLSARSDAEMFHIVLALLIMQCHSIQRARKKMAGGTFNLESQTGIALAFQPQEYVEPEKLSFNRHLYFTALRLKKHLHASSRFIANCRAFNEHIQLYQALCANLDRDVQMSAARSHSLQQVARSTLSEMEAEHATMKWLQSRLEAQIDIQRSLMAERDTRINIGMAQAAVRDSKLVRGIAFVTMVFLPGTFVATFFSMVFFDIDGRQKFHLRADASLWIYLATTLPLTILVITFYWLWSSDWLSVTIASRVVEAERASEGRAEWPHWYPPGSQRMDATVGAQRRLVSELTGGMAAGHGTIARASNRDFA